MGRVRVTVVVTAMVLLLVVLFLYRERSVPQEPSPLRAAGAEGEGERAPELGAAGDAAAGAEGAEQDDDVYVPPTARPCLLRLRVMTRLDDEHRSSVGLGAAPVELDKTTILTADGEGRLFVPTSAKEHTVYISAAGFVPKLEHVSCRDNDEDEEVWLDRAVGVITGQVLDDEGGALAGATVSAQPGGIVRVGDDGAFALPMAQAGGATLVVRAPGYAMVTRRIEATSGVLFTLVPATWIEGTVRLPDGKPEEMAGVGCAEATIDRRCGHAMSQRDGTFRLEVIPARPLFLLVTGRTGYAARVGPVTVGDGETEIVDVTLVGPRRVQGRFTLDGAPWPGELVRIEFAATFPNAIEQPILDVPLKREAGIIDLQLADVPLVLLARDKGRSFEAQVPAGGDRTGAVFAFTPRKAWNE